VTRLALKWFTFVVFDQLLEDTLWCNCLLWYTWTTYLLQHNNEPIGANLQHSSMLNSCMFSIILFQAKQNCENQMIIIPQRPPWIITRIRNTLCTTHVLSMQDVFMFRVTYTVAVPRDMLNYSCGECRACVRHWHYPLSVCYMLDEIVVHVFYLALQV
jgi:hypothetical protein